MTAPYLTTDQMNKITACLVAGRTWDTRSYEIEDTPEAKAFWDESAPQIADIIAAGGIVEMINDA